MLRLEGISVAYGGLLALSHVNVAVPKGRFVAVVGPNGAGKTTLFRTISGIVRPRAGRIVFEDQDITDLPPARRPHLGIAHVPEGRMWTTKVVSSWVRSDAAFSPVRGTGSLRPGRRRRPPTARAVTAPG